jgi:hypothetical protein
MLDYGILCNNSVTSRDNNIQIIQYLLHRFGQFGLLQLDVMFQGFYLELRG